MDEIETCEGLLTPCLRVFIELLLAEGGDDDRNEIPPALQRTPLAVVMAA